MLIPRVESLSPIIGSGLTTANITVHDLNFLVTTETTTSDEQHLTMRGFNNTFKTVALSITTTEIVCELPHLMTNDNKNDEMQHKNISVDLSLDDGKSYFNNSEGLYYSAIPTFNDHNILRLFNDSIQWHATIISETELQFFVLSTDVVDETITVSKSNYTAISNNDHALYFTYLVQPTLDAIIKEMNIQIWVIMD